LKGLYLDDDPFMDVEHGPDGIRLIERNCPFLNVAVAHPALCSISVSMLTRLLGVRVVREERFQAGDRRCVFRILPDVPVKLDLFQFEPEP
jgi:predicted ArsR family transcriptional regulator